MTKNSKNSGFTLVELIVVIVILAILAMIAFLSFSSQSSSARDSTRMADTTNITKWLWVFKAISWTYPMPDSQITINAGTGFMIHQWKAWNNVLNILKMSDAKDNLDSSYYSYSTDDTRSFYSVWWFLENPPTSLKDYLNPFWDIKNAAININAADYSKRYFFYKWDWVWILTESWTNLPAEQLYPANSVISLITESKSLNLNISSTNMISWTWLIVWAIQSTQNWNYNFNAPVACPSWFIPVPGNQEFSQPGFCVMKFEAKALNWVINSWYNWHNYSVSDTVASTPQDPAIINLTQIQALAACKSIWDWYHLITNNEWMTISRNLEQVSSNWSSNIVWSWYIFNWHNNGNPGSIIAASADDSDWLFWMTWWFWNTAFVNNRRTLTLSNWSIIWDLSGNVWEHVNKANSLDWTGFNNWSILVSNICTWSNWYYSFGSWDFSPPSWWVCNWANGYSYSVIGPKILNLNSDNGIWRLYSNAAIFSNNIFYRGRDWLGGGGIYMLAVSDDSLSWGTTGFRCAK